ncbi:MAG: NAD-dependent epimerase/dehydratase family protein, partial [Candidatus Thiodiazotropha sp. (ex Lucinoma borealis)]|nr:NAD-dependent epimerase/dehydratase family protein [Candidatus Thiodiazotropha sp. (ex Lucinoma borealis)]
SCAKCTDSDQPAHLRIPIMVAVGNIDNGTDWHTALDGIDTVIHLAARVHVMQESEADPVSAFRQVNVDGSCALARQAAVAGVRRLIYISSIKVNGERTRGTPFCADDDTTPEDPYGQSKWEAEQALKEIAQKTGLELVIIRPVLIYGSGVKGNLQRLTGLIRRGLPLPLASVSNRRSLLSIDNLLDFLRCCIDHPAAAGEVFLVADGNDLSTPQLIRKLATAMGLSARLIHMPVGLLQFAGRITGRSAIIERLTDDLQVDIEKNKKLLGWKPVIDVDSALAAMVNDDPR